MRDIQVALTRQPATIKKKVNTAVVVLKMAMLTIIQGKIANKDLGIIIRKRNQNMEELKIVENTYPL